MPLNIQPSQFGYKAGNYRRTKKSESINIFTPSPYPYTWHRRQYSPSLIHTARSIPDTHTQPICHRWCTAWELMRKHSHQITSMEIRSCRVKNKLINGFICMCVNGQSTAWELMRKNSHQITSVEIRSCRVKNKYISVFICKCVVGWTKEACERWYYWWLLL